MNSHFTQSECIEATKSIHRCHYHCSHSTYTNLTKFKLKQAEAETEDCDDYGDIFSEVISWLLGGEYEEDEDADSTSAPTVAPASAGTEMGAPVTPVPVTVSQAASGATGAASESTTAAAASSTMMKAA